jgi:hypothetical protein
MIQEHLQQLAELHRNLRLATAMADALMPHPNGAHPKEEVNPAELTRWVEAVERADTAYEALRTYRRNIGWPD